MRLRKVLSNPLLPLLLGKVGFGVLHLGAGDIHLCLVVGTVKASDDVSLAHMAAFFHPQFSETSLNLGGNHSFAAGPHQTRCGGGGGGRATPGRNIIRWPARPQDNHEHGVSPALLALSSCSPCGSTAQFRVWWPDTAVARRLTLWGGGGGWGRPTWPCLYLPPARHRVYFARGGAPPPPSPPYGNGLCPAAKLWF